MPPAESKICQTGVEGTRWLSEVCRWLWAWAMDVLYPCSCELCGVELSFGKVLCEECRGRLPCMVHPFCQRCGEKFDGAIDGAFTCPNCEGLKYAFEFARPAMQRCPEVMHLIHLLKYHRRVSLVTCMGNMLGESLKDERMKDALNERWPLVPVPIHRSRLVKRYFNQAYELSWPLAKEMGLPVWDILERTRDTGTQTALSRKQRLNNLKKSIQLNRRGRVVMSEEARPRGVILVDDVLTTGSTMNECARVLRQAGVERVVAISLMRG